MPTSKGCPKCNEYYANGHTYCGACGNYLGSGITISQILKKCVLICGICGLILMILEVLCSWLSIGEVFANAPGRFGVLFWLNPQPVTILYIKGAWIKALYVIEAIIVTYCLILLLKNIIHTKKEGNHFSKTVMTDVSVMLGLTMVCSIFFTLLTTIITGHSPVAPVDTDPSSAISLMHASVYEELYCRVLLLGVPIAIVKLAYKEIKASDCTKFLIGGFQYEKWMIVFIFISSLIFGLGHLSGWGLWKVAPTLISGFVFAYLFVRYGLYASIAMHFLTDMMQSLTWAMGPFGSTVMALLALTIMITCFAIIPDLVKRVKTLVQP